MNLFGPELERVLSLHEVSKAAFAKQCALHRNQMTNICTGRANNPSKVEQIFAALSAHLTEDEHIGIAAKYLEDRRNDIGYGPDKIIISRPDGKFTAPSRQKLIELYDTQDDIRDALDALVDAFDARTPTYPHFEDRSAHGAAAAAET